MGGAQRFPDGHTLICNSDVGTFFEVTRDSQVVWRYVSPATDSIRLYQGDTVPGGPSGKGNNTFRALRYPPDYPGFAGRNLTPGYPIELYRTRQFVGLAGGSPIANRQSPIDISPNPCHSSTTISCSSSLLSPHSSLSLYDIAGKLVYSSFGLGSSSFRLDLRSMPAGVYYCRLQGPGFGISKKLVKLD
jgi:hypothetical protein